MFFLRRLAPSVRARGRDGCAFWGAAGPLGAYGGGVSGVAAGAGGRRGAGPGGGRVVRGQEPGACAVAGRAVGWRVGVVGCCCGSSGGNC